MNPRQLTEKERHEHQVKMIELYQKLYAEIKWKYLAGWAQTNE